MNLGIETEYVEFKQSTSQMKRAMESLIAMLNKHGEGEVYFGVSDNGDVIGQDIGNKTLTDISEEINKEIRPTVLPDITTLTYDGKTIIKVRVTGNNKPYSASGKYLIRSGSENKKIPPELLKELVFTNSEELILKLPSINQDMSFNQLKQLYISNGYTIDNKTFAKNSGLLTSDGQYNQLAEILSDNNNCSIKVVRFNGNDKSDPIMRNEYGYKCMLLAMQQAFEYVCSLNETRIELGNNAARSEVSLFDESCLREAWNNACLHTKWARMIPPVIYVFDNRIEIVSIGGLPVDYPVEDFYAGISHPINRQLQKIMGQLRFVEQTGHGVPEILKKYGKEAFEITDSHITVTLRFPFDLQVRQFNISSLSDSQKKVYLAIKTQPTVKTAELTEITGLKISRVNSIIKELKDLGKIRRVGSNKTGHWEIVN